MNRFLKQKIIIAIYVTIFLVIAGLIAMAMQPEPRCDDGKKNGKETEVDCGGPVCGACKEELVGKDIVVKEAQVLFGGENRYDVVAEIHNPNGFFGGEKVHYTVEIYDNSKNVLAKRDSVTFILPNENKYIVEVGLDSMQQASGVNVTIDKVDWVKFTNFDSPQIFVRNQRFGLVQNTTDYAEAFGLVSNEGPYDFHDVTINVILLDERGVPIAANKTVQKTLDADSKREFRLTWPHKFPGTIASAEMQAEANVFDSLNYMTKYIPVTE
jgi:hypothetical protein